MFTSYHRESLVENLLNLTANNRDLISTADGSCTIEIRIQTQRIMDPAEELTCWGEIKHAATTLAQGCVQRHGTGGTLSEQGELPPKTTIESSCPICSTEPSHRVMTVTGLETTDHADFVTT